MTLVILYF
ncbi:putative protein phosphatase 2c-like protein, partial [Plasmodium gaboni]